MSWAHLSRQNALWCWGKPQDFLSLSAYTGGNIPRNFHKFPLKSLRLSAITVSWCLITQLSLDVMLKVEGTVSAYRVGTKEEVYIFLFPYNCVFLLFLNVHLDGCYRSNFVRQIMPCL